METFSFMAINSDGVLIDTGLWGESTMEEHYLNQRYGVEIYGIKCIGKEYILFSRVPPIRNAIKSGLKTAFKNNTYIGIPIFKNIDND